MSDTTQNRIAHPPGWRHSVVAWNPTDRPSFYIVFGQNHSVHGTKAAVMYPRGDIITDAEIIAINALIAANRPWGLSFRRFENAVNLMRSLVCPDTCRPEAAQ